MSIDEGVQRTTRNGASASAGDFLGRREMRLASARLTQLLVLGFGIAFIALVVGSYKYFIVGGANARPWSFVAGFGAVALLVTLVFPFAWVWPERGLRAVGNWIGHMLMTAILVLVYFVLFWPIGALVRARSGTKPIYQWERRRPTLVEGWRVKELPRDVEFATGRLGGKGRSGFFAVLVFFARRRNYFLIPAAVLLVAVGVALFFLQTSALAPFIYTLF